MLHSIPFSSILTPPDRQRKEFDAARLVELANSIALVGLIHPIIVREEGSKVILVAGERRLRAIQTLWMLGKHFRCAKIHIPEGMVPCLLQGDLPQEQRMEMELEENIQRDDLTWQEKSQAIAKLMELRQLQAREADLPPVTISQLTQEVKFSGSSFKTGLSINQEVRANLLVSKHLDDPDVQKAKNAPEALKIIKRKEELAKSAALGVSVGKTFSAQDHQVQNVNCLTWLGNPPAGQFDVILTDPPYGMGADEFGNSDGKAQGAHFYNDSYEEWEKLMSRLWPNLTRLSKPLAHLYMFCDIDRFHELKSIAETYGWQPFRTPLIWVNPTANRVPWIDSGPQRKWQAILYAKKGSKVVNRISGDVLTFPSDPNLNHQAQKPVALFSELLARSARPGDSVLDPFCGTGPIFPAAHGLKVKATGLEVDPAAYGIALKRIQELK